MRKYTQTGYCHRFGQMRNARRVAGLTFDERAAVRNGQTIYLAGCPGHEGETDRRIVAIGPRFYCRMP